MQKDKIKEVATQIVLLEKELQQGNPKAEEELEKIISKLNMEDFFAIDEYIYQENLLT
jgi:hypothetical protein